MAVRGSNGDVNISAALRYPHIDRAIRVGYFDANIAGCNGGQPGWACELRLDARRGLAATVAGCPQPWAAAQAVGLPAIPLGSGRRLDPRVAAKVQTAGVAVSADGAEAAAMCGWCLARRGFGVASMVLRACSELPLSEDLESAGLELGHRSYRRRGFHSSWRTEEVAPPSGAPELPDRGVRVARLSRGVADCWMG